MEPTLSTTTKRAILPVDLFATILDQPGAVWLDSASQQGDRGNNSIIACHPIIDVEVDTHGATVRRDGQTTNLASAQEGFRVLSQLWLDESLLSVGYISFEATLPWIGLSADDKSGKVPSARFLFYDSFLGFNHQFRTWTQSGSSDSLRSHLHKATPAASIPPAPRVRSFSETTSRPEYLDRVRRIQHHIHEGDIYQVNLTTRFDIRADAAPFQVYQRLRKLNPAAYGSFLNFGDYQVLSSSPERMFHINGNGIANGNRIANCSRIATSPIKGTIARRADDPNDNDCSAALLNSAKDRAELLMIVDLERNDLGKVARTGSVQVDHLFRPEVHPSLIHLVSDISATLRKDVTLIEVLKALLPGGSITGAPKRRAVEIILEQEQVPRSIYTGCIGYVHGGRSEFNIAIRTMYHSEGTWHVHAGGGIVADSNPEAEYDEMLLKAGRMFEALGVDHS